MTNLSVVKEVKGVVLCVCVCVCVCVYVCVCGVCVCVCVCGGVGRYVSLKTENF